MSVKELIRLLSELPLDLEVTVAVSRGEYNRPFQFDIVSVGREENVLIWIEN